MIISHILANQSCAQQRCGQTRSYFLGTTVRNTQISRMQIPVGGVRDMNTSTINPSLVLVFLRMILVGERQIIGTGPQVGRMSKWAPSFVRNHRKTCHKRYIIQMPWALYGNLDGYAMRPGDRREHCTSMFNQVSDHKGYLSQQFSFELELMTAHASFLIPESKSRTTGRD